MTKPMTRLGGMNMQQHPRNLCARNGGPAGVAVDIVPLFDRAKDARISPMPYLNVYDCARVVVLSKLPYVSAFRRRIT